MEGLPARIVVFKRFTQDLATLSKCCERQTAAITTDQDFANILSIGINGGPKGLNDCMCGGRYGCIHAEINALIKLTSAEPKKVMFTTLSPCITCAAAIINAPGGFGRVYYIEEWKDTAGLELLRNAGIAVLQI